MRLDWKWRQWQEEVLREVRFWPDRAAIARELSGHYEDHREDLVRLGYEPELAEKRALAAMGDARSIGRALDRAHHPLLGWLWEGTRVLLLALAATAAVTLLFAEGFTELRLRTEGQLQWTAPPAAADRISLEFADVYLSPGEIREEGDRFLAELHVWVEMRDPFGSGPEGLERYLQIRDDQGDLPFRTRDDRAGVWLEPEEGYIQGYFNWTDLSWTRYQWTIQLNLDHRPQWAEVCYPYGDPAWTLRAEWEAEG